MKMTKLLSATKSKDRASYEAPLASVSTYNYIIVPQSVGQVHGLSRGGEDSQLPLRSCKTYISFSYGFLFSMPLMQYLKPTAILTCTDLSYSRLFSLTSPRSQSSTYPSSKWSSDRSSSLLITGVSVRLSILPRLDSIHYSNSI